MLTETLQVPLALPYDIHIGNGLIARAGDLLAARFKSRTARIVSDETVAALYMAPLVTSLTGSGFTIGEPVLVPPGEASKSMARFQQVTDRLLASTLDRATIIIALGGGVVGDIAGFAAAVLLRGLDFVQIPTTLLAQVDSSIGGKTGINSPYGKNLLGAFHQPGLVLADIDTLRTLPYRELLGGYAEIVKHGIIADKAFFEWLEASGASLLGSEQSLQIHAIRRSCEIKAAIVSSDEREQGARAFLNFGHTFGHALEVLTGYGNAVNHGEAVAIGSIMALGLSIKQGLCPAEAGARVKRHFETVGLPTKPETSWGLTPQRMMEAMNTDKKNANGRIRFVLSRGLGQVFLSDDVPRETLSNYLAEILV